MKQIVFIFSLVLLLSSCDPNANLPWYPKSKIEYKLSGITNYSINYVDSYGATLGGSANGEWSYSYKNEKGSYYMLHAKNIDNVNPLTGEMFINGKSQGKQTTTTVNPYIDFSGTIQ